jgi:hypothetical protein
MGHVQILHYLRRLSFIKAMNDQKWPKIIKKGVHQGYERPKVVEHHQKGRSSRL